MNVFRRSGLIIALMWLCLSSGCCLWRGYPGIPEPMPPVPESRHPVAIANRVEAMLTQNSPLQDESRTHVLKLDPRGDWQDRDMLRLWQVLEPRLRRRNPHIHLTWDQAAEAEYRLTVTMDRGQEPPVAEFRLFRESDGELAWKHREPLRLNK